MIFYMGKLFLTEILLKITSTLLELDIVFTHQQYI